jgi:hypothetical protein
MFCKDYGYHTFLNVMSFFFFDGFDQSITEVFRSFKFQLSDWFPVLCICLIDKLLLCFSSHKQSIYIWAKDEVFSSQIQSSLVPAINTMASYIMHVSKYYWLHVRYLTSPGPL